VNNWNSISFLPTTTTLGLSSTKITHGTPINVTTSVAPASGSGTPTGDVAILTTSTLPSSQAQTFLTLSGGTASSSIDFFPGGYYDVSANYHGDSVFGSSTSSPVALTVTPENSNINFQVLNGYPPRPASVGNGGTVQYNTPLYFVIQPVGISAPAGKTNGNATGTATFKVDSITATVPLNAVGVASWTPPALSIGSHTASATYSGDASFNASSGSAVTFSVTQGQVFLNDNEIGPYSENGIQPGLFMNVGSTLTVGVIAKGWNTFAAQPAQIPPGTTAPTGTVQVCLGTYPGLYNDC
jgi:hypothetical protein